MTHVVVLVVFIVLVVVSFVPRSFTDVLQLVIDITHVFQLVVASLF